MTREEAIKWLSNLKNDLGQMQYQPLWHYAEAIDGIIEALQTDIVRCEDCKYKGKVGDLLVCRIHKISTHADDYCSSGERSEE